MQNNVRSQRGTNSNSSVKSVKFPQPECKVCTVTASLEVNHEQLKLKAKLALQTLRTRSLSVVGRILCPVIHFFTELGVVKRHWIFLMEKDIIQSRSFLYLILTQAWRWF